MFLKVSEMVVAIAFVSAIILFTLIAVLYYNSYKKATRQSQDIISDKDLLLMIHNEPDQLIQRKDIVERTGLTKNQVTYRIQQLQYHKLIQTSYTSSFKSYYQLAHPLNLSEPPALSREPFLTVEDILIIMKHYDFKVTMAELIMATGLPIHVLNEEMKYFIKNKIITKLITYDSSGMGTVVAPVRYILNEPYRSQPEEFLKKEDRINLELKDLLKVKLRNEDLV